MKKLSSSLIALMFIVNICAQTISPDNAVTKIELELAFTVN